MPNSSRRLEKYAEDIVSTLLYTTLQSGGIRSTAVDHAASHIGKASGLLLLLRSLSCHARKSRQGSYIPIEMALKHKLLVKEGGRSYVQFDSPGGSLSDAVFEMASVANAHLEKARQLAGTMPVEARLVLLPSVLAQVLLDTLKKVEFNVFEPMLSRGIICVPPMWYQIKVKWHSWRRKY
ncbi:unnamed protein product [Linum tenue]|uniref:Uncharacterized protein n=1 Tax=Linum tenue TaxID=586396 RepID=A0AAV0Q256_9ROSI|nr:unnamed protein product [Linum tenue]